MPFRWCARLSHSARGDFTVPAAPPIQPLEAALDVYDVARLFKCSHKTVRRMIADGRLPAAKIGSVWRIRPEDVAAILAGK